MDLVNEHRESKLFTEERLADFAKRGCHILYGIVGRIPDTKLDEYTTMAVALTPPAATKRCKALDGDAIELWVMDDDVAIESEKWEPAYFEHHFMERIGASKDEKRETPDRLTYSSSSDDDADDEEENSSNDDEAPIGSICKMVDPNLMVNTALTKILGCEQMISETTIVTSFATGHPIDLEAYLPELQNVVAKILHAFAFSKGGCEPKFKKVGSVMVPYWTKRQISSAKIDPEG